MIIEINLTKKFLIVNKKYKFIYQIRSNKNKNLIKKINS